MGSNLVLVDVYVIGAIVLGTFGTIGFGFRTFLREYVKAWDRDVLHYRLELSDKNETIAMLNEIIVQYRANEVRISTVLDKMSSILEKLSVSSTDQP